jgi:hypothetical protein
MPAADDQVTLTDASGSAQSNRPVSIARPFVQGEVGEFAQASINGSPLMTQCDVKNRWPDGSVKFAVVSFVVPSIPANGSVVVSFANQTSGNVQLGYTLEDSWASTTPASSARDQTYSLTLTGGSAAAATEATHGTFTQITRSRWHTTFCVNGAGSGNANDCGPPLHVDHSWAYLAQTKFTPHWPWRAARRACKGAQVLATSRPDLMGRERPNGTDLSRPGTSSP